MCGSEYSTKQEHAPTITSINGYNSYLIIVDRVIFLTASKIPPVLIAQKVINKFKRKNLHRTIRTDQGKELGRSHAFQHMVDLEGFTLELTGRDVSAQNIVVENPNKYLGMQRIWA